MLKQNAILVHAALNVFIAAVWLVNGLFCKLLAIVPRHKLIVARILGAEHAQFFTVVIGSLEVLMMAWILSRLRPRWCALTQAVLVAVMNTIEFFLAPDLLLFGRYNAVVAAFFIALVLINEYVYRKQAGDNRLPA